MRLTWNSQGKSMSLETQSSTSEFTTGLVILLIAQLLSAYMGAYVEEVYSTYGASWTENLFYSHFLSLPFFLPVSASLQKQWAKLASTPPMSKQLTATPGFSTGTAMDDLLSQLWTRTGTVPQGLFYLLINALTQLSCISGVNLLSAKSSAVTVTIVLNIRKLVSFILSTLIFGHELSGKMMFGSALVFGSGALYGWETSWRIPGERKRRAEMSGAANGSAEKKTR